MYQWVAGLSVATLVGLCFAHDGKSGGHFCARAKLAAGQGMDQSPAPPAAPVLASMTDTDVLHYDLSIEVNLVDEWLGGTCDMHVRSLVADLDTFHFQLRDTLDITGLWVGATPVSWTRLDGANIEVALDQTYQADAEFVLRVGYEGFPYGEGVFGSIVFRRRLYNVREVYTFSSPWYAHTWWPCKDVLEDKATGRFAITVPEDLLVASNGLLTAVEEVGLDQKQFVWETDYPTTTYLFCFAATNFDTFDATWDYAGYSMPVNYFIYPEHNTPGARGVWLKAVDMLTVFSDLYGLYPFVNEKYGMYEMGYGGGMEHQTMTAQGNFFEDVTAHELAHQWWGDDVTCATWHDIWLNEGFATYSEALWFENEPGSSGLPALHAAMAERVPTILWGSVYVYDISDDANIFNYNLRYLKAAWVVHMLRFVVGDEAFYDILATYRSLYTGGNATTADFQAVCEAVHGQDLTWFFYQWVYDDGAPMYRYGWTQRDVDGARYAELYLAHHPWGDLFTMPVEVEVVTASGAQRFTVWNDAMTEHFLLPVGDETVEAVMVDPDGWILKDSMTDVGFAEGPPKIVSTLPAPGETAEYASVETIEVVFHKPVHAEAVDFGLLDTNSDPIPFEFAYDADRQAAVLSLAAALEPGTYTLTIADEIRDDAANKKLDGEVAGELPSGDGEPSGDAEILFSVGWPVGDCNCSGTVGFDDIQPLVRALAGEETYLSFYPDCEWMNADCNGDGAVDFDDIQAFIALLD